MQNPFAERLRNSDKPGTKVDVHGFEPLDGCQSTAAAGLEPLVGDRERAGAR